MKIAFVGGRGVPARYGGFETATEEIGARLAERGHEVTVYCRSDDADDDLSDYRGMKRVCLPSLRKQSLETLSHTFVSLLHAFFHAPDVLIVLNPANGPLCVIPRLRGTPFALHVDGLDWERSKWPKWGRRYIYFAAWFGTKIAPELIADSAGIQDFYREQWSKDSWYASYGTERFASSQPEVLAEYGLQARNYLLVVARLEPENHTDFIIDVFRKLKTDMPLVIVGGTTYESDYVRKLKSQESEDRVKFLGGVYDQGRLRELLIQSFVYVHGHSVGGTNPVLLEAMGCGACVAYLDVPFNIEVTGEAGIAFPLDTEQATAKIQAVIDDPQRARALVEQAQNRVEERYTWERATNDYEALCQRLLDRRGDVDKNP